MNIVTFDVSTARRLRGVLNTLRDVGFAIGGILVLVSLAIPKLLPLVIVYFIANTYLGKGRWLAPGFLAVMWVSAALYFLQDYHNSVARFNARVESGIRDSTKDPVIRKLIEGTRYIAWACFALAALNSAAIALSITYSRMAVRPVPELDHRRRLALRLKLLYAGMTPRATLYYGLSVTCALVAISPALVVFAHIAFFDWKIGWLVAASKWASEPGWLEIVMTVVFGVSSLYFFSKGKRWASLPVTVARAIDSRQPILLLRSFQDDTTPLTRTTDQWEWMRSMLVPTKWTLEETIEQLLIPYGPLIAIGRPAEPVPPAGAAREYVPNDRWRARIKEHISEARVIVVILGKTEGLEFEYRALVELGALAKLIVVLPPVDAADTADRWTRFRQVALSFAEASADWNVSRALAAFFRNNGTICMATCRWRHDEDCYGLALDRCLAAIFVGQSQPTCRS